MLKTLTSIYGGQALAAVIKMFLRDCCSIKLADDPLILSFFACVGLASLLIGVLQNEIRRMRGRPSRPLIDVAIWRRNFLGPRPEQR
jgi:hypothetical protein